MSDGPVGNVNSNAGSVATPAKSQYAVEENFVCRVTDRISAEKTEGTDVVVPIFLVRVRLSLIDECVEGIGVTLDFVMLERNAARLRSKLPAHVLKLVLGFRGLNVVTSPRLESLVEATRWHNAAGYRAYAQLTMLL
jgi:hypothetical protein